MHIVSKFQFFVHIFAMVKLKKTDQKFEMGKKREKMAGFCIHNNNLMEKMNLIIFFKSYHQRRVMEL